MNRGVIVLSGALIALACSRGQQSQGAAAPSNTAAAAPDIGAATVVDQQDLGGLEPGPGSGLVFHNESNAAICRLYVWKATETSHGQSRIATRLEPGGTTGIPLPPGAWTLRAEACTGEPLLQRSIELADGKALAVTAL